MRILVRVLIWLWKIVVKYFRPIIGAIAKWWDAIGPDRQRGLRSLSIALLCASIFLFWSTRPPRKVNDQALRELLHNNRWVSYDPTDYDPFEERYPTEQSLRNDLTNIRKAGFTAIVTTGSRGTLKNIPGIARECGLELIMGVWNPNDLQELGRAASQKSLVKAYVVGYDRLGEYRLSDLTRAIAWLKCRTGRPVTTCEYVSKYETRPDLQTVGDWLFADVHVPVSGDLAHDVKSLNESARKMSQLAARLDRPLLLGMITYPWFGVRNASLDAQREFHSRALGVTRSDAGLAYEAALVFHSAFDVRWKERDSRRFSSWDPYTGLLDQSGNPRPAVMEIIK